MAARFDADRDLPVDDLTERDQLKGALAACLTHRAPLWAPHPRVLRTGDDTRAVQAFLHQNGLYLIAGAHPLDWTAPSDQVEAATRQAIDRAHQLRVAVATSHLGVSDVIDEVQAALRHTNGASDEPGDPVDIQAEYDAFAARFNELPPDRGMTIWHLAVLTEQLRLGQAAPRPAGPPASWPEQERSHARLATWMLDHLTSCTQEYVACYLTYRGARTVRGKPYTQPLVSALLRKPGHAGGSA